MTDKLTLRAEDMIVNKVLAEQSIKNRVVVWAGKGDIPDGWEEISEKEAMQLLNIKSNKESDK